MRTVGTYSEEAEVVSHRRIENLKDAAGSIAGFFGWALVAAGFAAFLVFVILLANSLGDPGIPDGALVTTLVIGWGLLALGIVALLMSGRLIF